MKLRKALELAFRKEWSDITGGVGLNGKAEPCVETMARRAATSVIGTLCEMKTGSRIAKDGEGQFNWEESERIVEKALAEIEIPKQVIETLEFYSKLRLSHGTDIGFQAREALKLISE